ncbi:MAG: glycosyltransferase family 2 protein [Methanobacterium sp.]|uniref:glycosyltransferase family 2 protein n=1 Tax=Methanobacterium sp. TaxID=2164 RepID=UPI003D650C70|nr:glycosyltransferase family 2 protein [Methanobacterium sp.]
MRIITIIPAYNEEKAILGVIKKSLEYSDVLVVDDGSKDDTYNLAKKTGAQVIKHDKNRGKGAAIKTGLKKALKKNYEAYILLDGDGQHDPDNIPSFISSINGFGLVIGSRFIEGTPKNMPLSRRLSNRITTSLIKYVTDFEITDSQSGFRAISADAAEYFINIKHDDYAYESEMLYVASKSKIKVKEVGIDSIYQLEKSHITKIHVFKYVFFIIKLLIRKTTKSDK